MASIAPTPKLQFIDANGNPLVGGKLYTYAAGTTTPLATYTDSTGNVANTNPVILDTLGEASVWMGSASYKLKLTTSTDVEVWTVDNVGGLATTGDLNALVASLASSSGSSMIGFIQSGAGAVATTLQVKLRQDYVHVADFGASPSASAAVNTAAIIAAASAATGKRLVFATGTYQVDQLIATLTNVQIVGNSAVIQYTANVVDSSLKLVNCTIENLTIDGNEYNVGNSALTGVKDSAPITASGDFFRATGVIVKNLKGLQDNYQYGIVCKGSTVSTLVGCKFENIRTRTDSTNTGGFCGGYMIYQGAGESMTPAAHTIDTCTFEDIYTLQNNLGQLYPDSDGIRSYFYDIGGGDAAYVAAVRSSVIKVTNCSFVNVLKSACKLQDANAYIENCRVNVDDLKDQGQLDSYTGFRYQQGNYVSITNCSVVGKMRSGALLQGANSFLENFYFGASPITSGNSQSLCWIGVVGDNTAFCGLTNVTCASTDFSIDVYGCDHVVANNCNLQGAIAIIHCDRLQITNSKLNDMIQNAHYSSYTPYLNRAEFSNCEIVYFNNDGYYANYILSANNFDLVISDCEITYCRAQFVETSQPFKLIMSDTFIDVTSQYGASPQQRRLFDMTAATTFYLKDVRVKDNRTTTSPQLLVYANSSNENIVVDGFEFTANASSNYTTGFYLAPSANNIELRNLTFNDLPASAYALDISQSTNPCVDTLRCNYTTARVRFYDNGKAIINMFHGTLTPTPGHIVTGGTVTVSEYNTTFL
jgi:hypothetical protein